MGYASAPIERVSKRQYREWLKRRPRKHKKSKKLIQQQRNNRRVKNAEFLSSDLRQRATPAELRLKTLLTQHRIVFQFQYPIVGELRTAIIDFCLPRKNAPKLFIEIDGGYHESALQRNLDQERTEWLLEYTDCEIIRFKNAEVLHDGERVIKEILCRNVWIRDVVGKCEAMGK